MVQEVIKHYQAPNKSETFEDLYWDNFLQVTAKVGRQALCCLDTMPYIRALFKQGLNVCWESDPEAGHLLDQLMEYTGAVGSVMLEQIACINHWVPDNETFGGDGLRRFIGDYEDCLGEVEDQQQNLVIVVNC